MKSRPNYRFFGVSFLIGLAVLFANVGKGTPNWAVVTYEIPSDLNGTNATIINTTNATIRNTTNVTMTNTTNVTKKSSFTQRFGIWQTCWNDNCTDYKFDDFTCFADPRIQRSGEALRMRFDVMKAMLFGGIFFGSFSAASAALCVWYRRAWLLHLTLIFNILAGSQFAVSLPLFVHTVDSWMNCGYPYCTGQKNCQMSYDYSFALVCAALILSIINILFIVCIKRKKERKAE